MAIKIPDLRTQTLYRLPHLASHGPLPPPSAFGLPPQFTQWREDQMVAAQLMTDAPTRFVGLTMPTGSGKSLATMAGIILRGGRGVVLTHNNGLLDQYGEDFGGLGMMTVKGQRNYPCKALAKDGELSYFKVGANEVATCDEGPCHAGVKCSLKEAGCEYYDRIRTSQSKLLVTNYALWLAQRRYGQGMGPVDVLVLDEAHQAADELASALSVSLDKWLLDAMHISHPPGGGGLHKWRDWASFHLKKARQKLEALASPSSHSDLKYRQRLRSLERSFLSISELDLTNWVEEHDQKAYNFKIVNAAPYAEQYLFQGAKRVVLLSATLTPKTLQLLGIQSEDATHWECPSRFDIARRPVWYVPTCRVNQKMTPAHWNLLVSTMDNFIDSRIKSQGIVHTVSYARRDILLTRSRHQALMLTHGKETGAVASLVKAFKAQQAHGSILISPSVTTGWDFPGAACRWQVVIKLPIPDTTSPVMKARNELDPEYLMYLTAQSLVQAVGRGMRYEADWCETLLMDDSWKWFVKDYRHLLPHYFLAAVRASKGIPAPLQFAT